MINRLKTNHLNKKNQTFQFPNEQNLSLKKNQPIKIHTYKPIVTHARKPAKPHKRTPPTENPPSSHITQDRLFLIRDRQQ